MPRPPWLDKEEPQDDPGAPKEVSVPVLRAELPVEKAVQTAIVEHSWSDYYRWVVGELKRKRPHRSALLAFERALVRVGHLAQPVRALLDELGVDSVEDLKVIVNAYRMGQRASDEDRTELALQTIERHIANHRDTASGMLDRIRAAVGKVEQHAGKAGAR